ncbi:MAG: RloB domain-containing protein [Parachlamydiales bacterium]|nr:RloB domain-containing protein [Candidatus Acheromyda pituitae]
MPRKVHPKILARNLRSFQRKHGTQSRIRVLIVCEGKTEQAYFNAFRKNLRLSGITIEIPKDPGGTAPKNLLDFAKESYSKDSDYDRLYCVFDKDRHSTYLTTQEEIDRLRNASPSMPIYWIASNPCFEVWIISHFKLHITAFGTCKNVEDFLQRHIDYRKNDPDLFEKIDFKREEAKSNVKKLLKQQGNNPKVDPYTNMYELIEYLEQFIPSE